MTAFLQRVAGAPISWGVVEPPGWGLTLEPQRVLGEMAALGLGATELGPTGYLGDGPERVTANLAAHDLRLVGGFLPVTLHAPELDLAAVAQAVTTLARAGGEVVVLAAAAADLGYESRVTLGDQEWVTLVRHLADVDVVVREHGMRLVLHPHVGTAIEGADAVERLLEVTAVPLCLDTGHLMIGGTDPLALARRLPQRVAHVHLKDVSADLAARVADQTLGYAEAVRAGLYAPLGQGDVDVAAVVQALERGGYQGWYVLEQDTVVSAASQDPGADVRRSLEFLLASIGT